MPYRTEWVEPETALEYKDVTVYHVYKNDDMEQCRRTYWFTCDVEGGESDGGCFDVRELPQWSTTPGAPIPKGAGWEEQTALMHAHILAVLRAAIDAGSLTTDGAA